MVLLAIIDTTAVGEGVCGDLGGGKEEMRVVQHEKKKFWAAILFIIHYVEINQGV